MFNETPNTHLPVQLIDTSTLAQPPLVSRRFKNRTTCKLVTNIVKWFFLCCTNEKFYWLEMSKSVQVMQCNPVMCIQYKHKQSRKRKRYILNNTYIIGTRWDSAQSNLICLTNESSCRITDTVFHWTWAIETKWRPDTPPLTSARCRCWAGLCRDLCR